MLDHLPIEIILAVFTHLTIRDIHAFQRVHSTWNAFVRENEASVFYSLALNHGFVKPNQTLDASHWDAREDRTDRVASWKDLCMRRVRLEKNWEGRGQTPSYRSYENTIGDVHRFKVDERPNVRIIVSTHRNGGLRVTDMDDGEALWELDDEYVRPYAHCEYDKGYLIFDRSHPHALEVWRLRSDGDRSFSGVFSNVTGNRLGSPYTEEAQRKGLIAEPHPHVGKKFGPEALQFNAEIVEEMRGGRVDFVPWALFEPEHHPRAYRFVYPTLLAGSETGQCLYLFDCPSATIIETIEIPPPEVQSMAEIGAIGHFHIQYVELGTRHVFVCSPSSIIILPRTVSSSGERVNIDNATRQVLHFPQADPALRVPQLVKHYAAKVKQAIGPSSNEALQEFTVSTPSEPHSSTALVQLGVNRQNFTAVHVSSSGSDFVGITGIGMLYIVKDFERVIRGEATFSELTVKVDLGTGAYNLAYEDDRVLVQTAHAIFIFNLHSLSKPFLTGRKHYGVLPLKPNILPDMTVFKLLDFTNGLSLRLMSCVKLSPTCIWLDWSKFALEEVERRRDPNVVEENRRPGGTGAQNVNALFPGELDGIIPEAVEEDHPAANRTIVRIGFLPGDSPLFGTLSDDRSNARVHL